MSKNGQNLRVTAALFLVLNREKKKQKHFGTLKINGYKFKMQCKRCMETHFL